jgi:hypothetical protein
LVRQATAGDTLPSAEFATREEAFDYTVQQSPLFHGAHSVEEDGQVIWRPYPDPATYAAIMNYGLAITRDARDVLEAANEQGAFVFWNHPGFEKLNSGLNPFHKSATRAGLLHGIEIANGDAYYPNAHRLALKHNLALIGVSDVHELIEWDYRPEAQHNPGHRPVTLVLAQGDSLDAMREALFARRTIVWWKDLLIGRKAHLGALLDASLSIDSVEATPWGIQVNILNRSDAPFKLRETSGAQLTSQSGVIEIAPNGITAVTMNAENKDTAVTLKFDVLNALVSPGKPARMVLTGS